MEAIAQFWLVYLIAFPVFLGLAAWNQIQRIHRFVKTSANADNMDNSKLMLQAKSTSFQGILPLIIWGACAFISAALLVISLAVFITHA